MVLFWIRVLKCLSALVLFFFYGVDASRSPTRRPTTRRPTVSPTQRPTSTRRPSVPTAPPTSSPISAEPLCDFASGLNLHAGVQGWVCDAATGLPSSPICTWDGVICDINNDVVEINYNLWTDSGTVSSSLGRVQTLTYLGLDTNGLTGKIPTELGMLTLLQDLRLHANLFTGSIPTELGMLVQLTNLNLRTNFLTGPIPTELGNMQLLNSLYLNGNSLRGAIPSELGALSNLVDLKFNSNLLSGTIPSDIGALAAVTQMFLSGNRLTGTIPSEIGMVSRLRLFSLGANSLAGIIPRDLIMGISHTISGLDLGNNKLNGTIPTEIGLMTLLTLLNLESDSFQGMLPVEISNLVRLTEFSVAKNQLTRPIPTEICRLTSLVKLYLDSNSFSGTVPTCIDGNFTSLELLSISYCDELAGTPLFPGLFKLNALTWLDLKHSKFFGTIPSEVGLLTNLQWLDIGFNSITGTIPLEIGNLNALTSLFLYFNRLNSTIPGSIYTLTGLTALVLMNNYNLRGSLSNDIGRLTNLAVLSLSFNSFTGTIPSIIGSLPLIDLQLDNNFFTGAVPASLCTLDKNPVESFVLCSSGQSRNGCPLLLSIPYCLVSVSFNKKHLAAIGSLQGVPGEVPVLATAVDSVTSSSITVRVTIATTTSVYLACNALPRGANLTSTLQISTKNQVYVEDKNASYALTGLDALETYDVYCYANSFAGVPMNVSGTASTLLRVTTSCCKQVGFLSAPSIVISGRPSPFKYYLAGSPLSSVTLIPQSSNSSVYFSPLNTSFVAYSGKLTSSFIVFGPPGTYSVTLAAVGSSAAEYDLSLATTTVTIVTTLAFQAAPQLSSVRFAYNGGSAFVLFNAATDLAGITSPQWPCSDLFVFGGADVSACAWVNSSAVLMLFPARNSTVAELPDLPVPSSPISTSSTLGVRAACVPGSLCTANTPAVSLSAVFLPPLVPLVPSIVLTVPSQVGITEDVLIDPTSSSGGGGRPWQQVTWNVSTDGLLDTAAFSTLYLSSYDGGLDLSSVLRIPAGVLLPANYVFTLTLVNFLNGSASSSCSVRIVLQQVPQVTILGPSSVVITAQDDLLLQSFVRTSRFDQLSYAWTVLSSDGLLVPIASTSVDPRLFRLPAYSLQTGATYTFRVSVSEYGLSSTAQVSVYVDQGSLSVVIAGGSTRVTPIDKPLSLDASGSSDIAAVSGVPSIISFQWSCVVVSGDSYGSDCGGVLTSLNSSIAVLPAFALSATSSYQFTVVGTSGGKVGSQSVLVQAAPAGAPLVTLSASSPRVNAGAFLRLDGGLLANYNVSASWNLTSSGVLIHVDDISLSPLAKVFPLSNARSSISFSLGVDTSQLVPGATYTFLLFASPLSNDALTASSAITVTVNLAPSAGYLYALPVIGYAFNTSFALTCVGWIAEVGGYPLAYSFQYLTAPGADALNIRSKAYATSVSSALPPGIAEQIYAVTLLSTVYDSYGATAATSAAVQVFPSGAVSADLLDSLSFALNVSSLTYDIDVTIQAVNNIASYLSGSPGDLNVSTHDTAVVTMCNALAVVAAGQDNSSLVLDSLVNSLKLAYNSSVASNATLLGCVGLLRNLSSLVASDLSSAAVSNTALKVSEIVSLFIGSFSRVGGANATLGSDLDSVGGSLNQILTALVEGVLANTIGGQNPVNLTTDGVVLSVYKSLLTDLYHSQLVVPSSTASSASSLIFPADGIDACGSSASGYVQLSLAQWSTSPYLNATATKSPILRLSSSQSNYGLAPAAPSNASFQLTLAFIVEQDFTPTVSVFNNGTYNSTYSATTLPQCALHVGDSFSPCQCMLLSFTTLNATFSCGVTANLCAGLVSSTASPTASPTSTNVYSGGSFNAEYTSTDDVLEYTTLFNSAFNVFTQTITNTANPFNFSNITSIAVLAVVAGWILVLVLGLIYFRRWDILDHTKMTYAPSDKVVNNKKAIMTIGHLNEMRRHLNNAFKTGAFISEAEFYENVGEYNRRQRYIQVVGFFLFWCMPFAKASRKQISILVGGTVIPRLLQAIARYHPYLWFWSDRSMEKTRVLRFMTLLKSILLSIFISTIFFQVYFPVDSPCLQYNNTTRQKCLSVPSLIVGGQSECAWDGSTGACTVRPPPSDPAFVITVSILTTIIFAPLDIIFYLVLNTVCNRRPALEELGLDSFFWLGGSGNLPPDYYFNVDQAVSYVMRAFRAFEIRLEDGLCNYFENNKMELVLGKLGLQLKNGQIRLTWFSVLRYGSLEKCLTKNIKSSTSKAQRISANMKRYIELSQQESYLLQHFLMDQFDFVARTTLRRQFCHYAHDLPQTIHPVPWMIAWAFAISVDLFFIYWILAWGTANNAVAIMNWGANFSLSLVQEIFIVAVARIFIINVLAIEFLRPALRKLHKWVLRASKIDEEAPEKGHRVKGNDLADHAMDSLSLIQFISPACIAANAPEFRSLSSASIIRAIDDGDYYEFQHEWVEDEEEADEVYVEEEVPVEPPQRTASIPGQRGSTHNALLTEEDEANVRNV